jgi:hypothetical protein
MLGLLDMQLSVFKQIEEKKFSQHLLHGFFCEAYCALFKLGFQEY